MSNQAFRDVNTALIGGTAILGVQVARVSDEGEPLEFFADAVPFRQDVGLTRQIVMLELERLSDSKYRDLNSAVFTAVGGTSTGSAILGRVQSVEIRQSSTPLRDSGDRDSWIRSLGVTKIVGEAVVTFRDMAQLGAAPMVKGRKGTLTVKIPIPRTGFGLPAATATETHKLICMLRSMERNAQHAELSESQATFDLYGATDPWTFAGATGGKVLKPASLGWGGTVAFSVPPADAASSEAVSVANCVLVGMDVSVRHGEYARATYRFEARSSDGQTSPIS